DSGMTPDDFLRTHTLGSACLNFDDVDRPTPGKNSPTIRVVEQGLAFAPGKEKLLVSCRAGQSRSPAIAYLIACQQFGVQDAIKMLNPMRHKPNAWVIELGSAVLGNMEVRERFLEWCSANGHIKLSD